MAERGLTAGERQMVSSIFGSSIKLDAIRINDQPLVIGQDVPTPYGRIHWPPGMPNLPSSDDFSTASPAVQAEFLHEITHVWQDQHGTMKPSVLFEQLGRFFGIRNRYDLSDALTKPFDDLLIEQQGEVVKFIYLLRNGLPAPGATLTLPEYEAIFASRSSTYRNQPPADWAPAPLDPPRQCFIAGTPILLADGTVIPIGWGGNGVRVDFSGVGSRAALDQLSQKTTIQGIRDLAATLSLGESCAPETGAWRFG
jgi:hypothetical protein